MKTFILLQLVASMIIGFNSCKSRNNLPDQILNNFHLLEVSMNKSSETANKLNKEQIHTMQFMVRNYPDHVLHLYEKAKVAIKATDEFVAFVEKLQQDFEEHTGGRLENGALVGANEMDYQNDVLFGQGKVAELQQKINGLRITLNSLLDTFDQRRFKTDLYTDNSLVTNQSWDIATFKNTPLVATMAILSKVKYDAKNAEAQVLRYMLRSTTKICDYYSPKEARVISKSNKVMLGQEYEADILLAVADPEIYTIYVNGKPLKVEDGTGKLRIRAAKVGEEIFKGEIQELNALGQKNIYPFEYSFEVYKP